MGLPVDYRGDVTQEQLAEIEKLVAPEFADGEWITVENERDCACCGRDISDHNDDGSCKAPS